MASIFLMTTVAYVLLGLPNALLLGVIAGIAELIPIVGPALGAIPALLVAAVTGDVGLVAVVAGPTDPDQYLKADTAVQTLRWPAERGVGSRIDVTLTFRDAAGVLASHSFSIPAR